jgi:hypothetical protein
MLMRIVVCADAVPAASAALRTDKAMAALKRNDFMKCLLWFFGGLTSVSTVESARWAVDDKAVSKIAGGTSSCITTYCITTNA